MVRFILVIIVTYIFFWIIGGVFRFIRSIVTAFHAGVNPQPRAKSGRAPMPYSNVEDVDYEDITDKK